MFLRWIPLIIVILIVEWYAFQAIKTAFINKWLLGVYSLIVVLVLGNFFGNFLGMTGQRVGHMLSPMPLVFLLPLPHFK